MHQRTCVYMVESHSGELIEVSQLMNQNRGKAPSYDKKVS